MNLSDALSTRASCTRQSCKDDGTYWSYSSRCTGVPPALREGARAATPDPLPVPPPDRIGLPIKIMGWAQEPTSSECGAVTGAAACKGHPGERNHFKQVFRQKCNQVPCPVCQDATSRKTGHRVATRVRNFVAACKKMEDLPLTCTDLAPLWNYVMKTATSVRHVVIHPDGVPDITQDNFYAIGHRLFKSLGPVTAYVFCPHPYRLTDEAKEGLQPFLGTRGGDNREARYWDLVHRDALAWGSWEDYVQWGPHFHGAVCGWLTRADFFHEDTGWNYKNLGERNLEVTNDPQTGKERDSLTGFFQYLASHAMVQQGHQIFRAGGLMHSRHLKGQRFKLKPEEVFCGCGEPVIRFTCGDGGVLGNPIIREPEGSLVFYKRRKYRWEVSLKNFPDNPPAWLNETMEKRKLL